MGACGERGGEEGKYDGELRKSDLELREKQRKNARGEVLQFSEAVLENVTPLLSHN